MVALLLALALQTAAPLDQAGVRDLCSAENFSQAEYADCLRRKVTESEAALRNATVRAAKRIESWDENAPYLARSKAALAASATPFAQYRAAQCTFAGSLSGGAAGNSREVGRLACVYELNMRRAVMLDALTGRLPAR